MDFDENPHASIDELLESKCPCYARFDHIFGTRANVTPLSQFDSRRPTSLFPDGHSNEDDDWEESQSQHPANSSHDFTSINDFVPPLSDADPDESTPDVVTSTALVRYNPNQASTSSSFPYTSVPLNPSPGTVPVTPTPLAPRRSFANQNNSTESALPKERPDKAKSSLATAYQSVSEKKYEMLETHLFWQKDRFEQESRMRQAADNRRHQLDEATLQQKEKIEKDRLGWEKERYKNERDERVPVAAAEKTKQEDRLAAAERWLEQGKSVSEVESLLKMVFQ
ncbi:hypothetical protein Pst134EA_013550 [Puccinia striiformis f. sp. tritici]|uniref:hypothetical protein n=1 Tax=Puccinia striiformis f. sp. tritici TaxID=168172 RepID=UPI0020074C08|nr:hypothetical protein Pst134EA_013550 [Puccinia striiformis f. sp. tritici]KAH9465668.1 hypothetical protein Pst134EA_013550 [Puccinia striiformis f. sp. tritici]